MNKGVLLGFECRVGVRGFLGLNFVSRVSGLKSNGTKKYKDNKRIQDCGGINYGLFIHTARYLSCK